MLERARRPEWPCRDRSDRAGQRGRRRRYGGKLIKGSGGPKSPLIDVDQAWTRPRPARRSPFPEGWWKPGKQNSPQGAFLEALDVSAPGQSGSCSGLSHGGPGPLLPPPPVRTNDLRFA